MERFQGLIGIVAILGIAFLFSNNKKRINYRLVGSGLLLQTIIAVLILKVEPVKNFFQSLGKVMTHIEAFAHQGAAFVYGGLQADNHAGGSIPYSADGVFILDLS